MINIYLTNGQIELLNKLFEGIDYCNNYNTFDIDKCYCDNDLLDELLEDINSGVSSNLRYINFEDFSEDFKLELWDFLDNEKQKEHYPIKDNFNDIEITTDINNGIYYPEDKQLLIRPNQIDNLIEELQELGTTYQDIEDPQSEDITTFKTIIETLERNNK